MHPLKAHVQNGRLVLDDPTDLPEGELVYVQVVHGIVPDAADDLDDADRDRLHAELDAAIVEADAGQTEGFGDMVAELRQRL